MKMSVADLSTLQNRWCMDANNIARGSGNGA